MLGDVAFVAGLAWISAGIGARLLGIFKLRPSRPDEPLAQAIPLGLGALALSTLLLGVIGRLDRTSLTWLLAIASVAAAGPGTKLLRRSGWLFMARTSRTLRRGTAIDRALLGLTAAALLGSSITACLPVTDGDALCYHLQVPKVFLAQRSISFHPDLHETVYPLVTELLDAIALAFRGPAACRWVQMLLGLALAANVTLLARPILKNHAWWAGAITLLVPAISNGMSAPLNDVALAAFGTAAIAATMRSLDRPSFGSAMVAGCFTGLALGVKYPALVLFGLLLGLFLWRACAAAIRASAANPGRSFGMAAAFAVSAVAIGGCWYLRAYLNTGNPVFPYFRRVFGGSGLDEVLDPTRRAMAVTPWSILTALVPMTIDPDRFESFSHQFGPLFLLVLPALAFERAPRRIWGLVLLGYAFLMICVTQRQSMRFVLTALGPMAIGVAYLMQVWSRRRSIPSRLILGVLLVCLVLESSQALARGRTGLRVLVGKESAEQFLNRREPTYRVGRWIGENLPSSARLIGQDHRGFYIPRDYTMELAHRRRTGLGRHHETAWEVIASLRRSGFTHLMFCPPVPETAVEFDPTLGRILAPWIAEHEAIYREDITDADDVTRRYAIYALDDRGEFATNSHLKPKGAER